MEILILIYLNLEIPKREKFCENESSGINEICLGCDKLRDEWRKYNVALIGV